MRVLHIIENLDRGAVENWLVRMFRHGRERGDTLDWTFYCALGREGKLDDEVRRLGGRIVYSPVPLAEKRRFITSLRQELRDGNYEVLHCHHDLVSAIYLAASVGIPLRKRLVHVHNADESVLTPNRLKAALLRPILRRTCLTLADGIIGISNHTLDTFLAGRQRRPNRDRVHYYGINPASFLAARMDRKAFRRELGVTDDARILLFAGRIVPEKNPLFALEVLAAMRRRDSCVVGVFVGSGSLENALRERAAELVLEESVRFLGWRSDVPGIMTACDWFILPRPEHPMEGLGIAVVEAQLAGLRLLLSRGIANDPLLPGSVWSRIGLDEGADRWAEEARALGERVPPGPAAAAGALVESPFDMDYAARDLVDLYGSGPSVIERAIRSV